MAEVNVNLQMIQALILQMKNAAAELQKIQKDMLRKYQQAGNGWRDQKYRELGDIVSECSTAITGVQMILSDGTLGLKTLEREIQDYEAVQLTATGSGGTGEPGGVSHIASPTFQDYREYLSTYGLSEEADFGMLDMRTVRDMCEAIAETKELFPEIDLKFVGSLQARNIHMREKLTDAYLEEYRKYYKGATDEQLMPFVMQNVEEDLRSFEPEQGVIAQSYFLEEGHGPIEDAMKAFNGITVSEAFGASYDYFISVRENDVRCGWKPQNCISPKATMDHELGHQIAGCVDAHNDAEIQSLFRQFSQLNSEQKAQVLSGYAGENIHEFIAEAWSEYRNNPQCRECARCVAERMIELHEAGRPILERTLRR